MATLHAPGGDFGAAFALDSKALAGLKQQAKAAPREAVAAAATQFEALFVQQLLKSMRDALPQDGPLASDATRSYTGMLDQQLAQQLAHRGIGLKKALVDQLTRNLPDGGSAAPVTSPAPVPSPAPGPFPLRPATTQGMPISRSDITPTSAPAAARNPATGAAASPAPPPGPGARSMVPAAVQDFVERIRPYAEAAAKTLGIPATMLIAQAGLETGWGRSQPKAADGTASHNLFGVKATGRWSGGTTAAMTTEFVDGKAVASKERFRTYDSYAASFADFAQVLRGNRRYAEALANTHDGARYAQSLQRAGYATDPAYADKLTRAIHLVARHTGASARGTGPQVLAGSADTTAGAA